MNTHRRNGWAGWWLLAALALAPSCAQRSVTSSATGTAPDLPLTGTIWRVETLGPDATLASSIQTELRIGHDGRVTGSTGCNRFTGTATFDATALTFSPLATTRRACDETVMGQEKAILTALETTRSWAIEEKHLALFDADQRPVLKLARSKSRSISISG